VSGATTVFLLLDDLTNDNERFTNQGGRSLSGDLSPRQLRGAEISYY
jgi:hypothetical protein